MRLLNNAWVIQIGANSRKGLLNHFLKDGVHCGHAFAEKKSDSTAGTPQTTEALPRFSFIVICRAGGEVPSGKVRWGQGGSPAVCHLRP